MNVLVTGGAGFIGSNLSEYLIDHNNVKVIDNLNSGKKENLPEEVDLIEADLREKKVIDKHFRNIDAVFHFAANPKVNSFPKDRDTDFENNLKATKNVLECCERKGVEDLVFASSSVVYGEDAEIPTPEEANLDPISMYGATKAGAEHMCQVYSRIFGLDLNIVRLANIVGPRNQKGVVFDFVKKLEENPEKLEILGDGRQRKSYLYIEQAVEGIIAAWNSEKTVFNIGSRDSIDVTSIAEIVSEEMGVQPEFSYTGGRKGWKGDVPEMRLEIKKLQNQGWKPGIDSEESIRRTVQDLLQEGKYD